MFSSILHWSQIKHQYAGSLILSTGIDGISSWKFIAFIVVTYKRPLSFVSWCTIGCPPLSILISLRVNCRYQNGFSAKEPVKAEFEFVAMAVRSKGGLLNIFSWMNCFYRPGTIKSLCQRFYVAVLNWSISYLRHSLFLIVFFEHHANFDEHLERSLSILRSVHNTQANIGILVYHVEVWSRSK